MSYQYKIGYTQGTFDMFHIGHLNLLRNAKALCGKLIVGVNSDDLVYSYKNKRPIISQANRAEIISELRCVDDVIICSSLDKRKIWDTLKFDVRRINSNNSSSFLSSGFIHNKRTNR